MRIVIEKNHKKIMDINEDVISVMVILDDYSRVWVWEMHDYCMTRLLVLVNQRY